MRYRSPLLAAAALCAALLLPSAPSWALSIGVSINIAPPALPVYTQPPLPAPGYLWAPGYWAWADGGYYWVPGTWVEPPQPGLLWTPGYWGWSGGVYLWHGGYWGRHVGFYGGVNYGFGYGGVGYAGGYWAHGAFFYNRAVNRIPAGVHLSHVYSKAVNGPRSHVSFNGGRGGVQARPTAPELAAAREPHVSPISAQRQQERLASRNPGLRATANHGRPSITATARPGQFSSRGGASRSAAAAPGNATHGRPGGNVHLPERQPGRTHTTARHSAAAPRAASAPHTPAAPHSNAQRQPGPRAHAQRPSERQGHPAA